jgi:phage tail-like protein
MIDQPIHYAVLRYLDQWDKSVKPIGLELQPDGVLMLARVPGTPDGKRIVVTNDRSIEASGLAIGDCKDLYIADTKNHRIIATDSLCNSRMLLGVGGAGSAPSQFHHPRGLLVVKDSLYVSDSGNGRVQVFRLPSLELRAIWEGVLEEPTALAADSGGRIYVLDRGLKSVLRFRPWGIPDDPYNAEIANHLDRYTPHSLAIDGRDRLYVSDEESNTVLRFDLAPTLIDAIQGDKPARPRSMTSRGNWLYVADKSTGAVWIFDCEAGVFLGTLPDYCGPVSALAVDESGALYIRPGLEETYHTLHAGMASISSGTLTAGPFDAGAGVEWERVHVDVDLPNDTDAALRIFTASEAAAAPDWSELDTLATSLDTLIISLKNIARLPPEGQRYLWLRVELHSDIHPRTSPRLLQVQAETTAQSYLDYLPAVYSRNDSQEHFLEHCLAAFRSQLGDLELELEELPRRFDPLTAPEDHLPWLASWLALHHLPDLPTSEVRNLLPTVHQLYELHGTPTGIRDFVELYTGVRPAIFEAFRERHVWQLGTTSLLGFDTALADGLPDGMIVPGHTFADLSCQGLRGDYYQWK